MKRIICNFSMFTLNQEVLLLEDENTSPKVIANSTISELPFAIAGMCDEHDINNVLLFGNKEYGERLAEDICKVGALKYSNEKIIVEVKGV